MFPGIFPGIVAALIQTGVFSMKVLALCGLQLTVRWTLPPAALLLRRLQVGRRVSGPPAELFLSLFSGT